MGFRIIFTVFFPLLVVTVGLLLWLGLDKILHRWAREQTHLQVIACISRIMPIAGTLLVLAAFSVGAILPDLWPYISIALPFLVALAVLMVAYGASLRRLTGRKVMASIDNTDRRLVINATIGLLVSLLLFWGMGDFAQVVGRGLAQKINEEPAENTQPVLLYSTQDLHLDPIMATQQVLSSEEGSAYRYRYEGLRLLLVDNDQYFFIGRNWQSGGALIVLLRAGTRIEFVRNVG